MKEQANKNVKKLFSVKISNVSAKSKKQKEEIMMHGPV